MALQQGTVNAVNGEQEHAQIIVPDADFAESVMNGKYDDGLIVFIPVTGKATFRPSTEKADGKRTKATFVVATVGSGFVGEQLGMSATDGDIAGLPLSLSLSLPAAPPNRKADTIDAALNRKTP